MILQKKHRRDWHNWWNEARQILTMLSTVAGFNVYNEERVMLSGAAGLVHFDPVRSTTVKRLALDWHGAAQQPGWELHHIYPVEYATCDNDMALIDSRENLLYIPATEHRKIPNKGNLSVKFTYQDNQIILINPVQIEGIPKVLFTIPTTAIVKKENLEIMRKFNEKLLSTVA
jgi:hypothetical protein